MARKVNVGAMVAHDVFKLDTPDMQVVQIPLSQLIVNEHNFFTVEDVQELADDIALNGLYSPLTVCAAGDGKYRIVAGHRRRKALELLGRKDAPCIVKNYDGEDSEMVALIQSNLTSRELTYYEKMQAVVLLEKALRSMKERGVIELPGKLRAYVADVLKVSETTIARADAINAHLSKAWKSDYKKANINDSVAYELSQCDDALQRDLHDLYKGNVCLLDAKDVKAHKKAAAAGFAPLKCPKEPYYCIEPCVGTDKRAAAVKRGECPGCCHDCDKADGCEWVCGRVSKAHRAHAEAENREAKRKQANEEFEASPLGKLRRRLRETLAEYGVHSYRDLSHVVYNNWLWTDDPTAYHSIYLSDLLEIAEQFGIDLQELLFGNPEGAPLRQLDEQMQQAVAEPQPAAPSIPEVPDTTITAGKETCLPCAAWFPPDVLPPDGARIIAQDTDDWYDEGIFAGCVLKNTPLLWREVVRWTLHPDDEAYTKPVQQAADPQPAPVWHPYPAEHPEEGQTVLTLSHSKYNRGNYAAYIYRANGWYLPEFPDDGLMSVDVRWWSAELPPEVVK